jgi:hypothetical protein
MWNLHLKRHENRRGIIWGKEGDQCEGEKKRVVRG